MKTLSLILLLASLACAHARELQVGDLISWEYPRSGKPRMIGVITAVSRQVGRPTYILVRSQGDTWQVWRENRPMLIATTNTPKP